MLEPEIYYEGAAVRARVRVLGVDPITEARTPVDDLLACTIRFRQPGGSVLAEHTLASGVQNAGNGYYWATAVPTMEGRHQAEFESGGALPARTKVSFTVEPF